MHKLLATTVLTLGLLATPAFAKGSQKFESTLSAAVTSPVKVEVIIGENLAYRANNLPKTMKERGSARFGASFGNNGHYGEKDLNHLADRLQKKFETRLTKEGVTVDANADTVLRLVLTDAKPNRPTFTQLSNDVSLSYQSYGVGGASFEGQLLTADGTSLGELSYAWYETDIRDAAYANTWSDAHRAIDRFARKTAKSLN